MNTRIIDRLKNWNVLPFKEAINIKEIKPTLNTGLKAPKELHLVVPQLEEVVRSKQSEDRCEKKLKE